MSTSCGAHTRGSLHSCECWLLPVTRINISGDRSPGMRTVLQWSRCQTERSQASNGPQTHWLQRSRTKLSLTQRHLQSTTGTTPPASTHHLRLSCLIAAYRLWPPDNSLQHDTTQTLWETTWWRGVVVASLVQINEVYLRWARLVLGWVTVSGFDSRRRHFISVCNQPLRSTQPSTLCGTVKWVPAKGRWCSAAGE